VYNLFIEKEVNGNLIGYSKSSSGGFTCETKIIGIVKGNKISLAEFQIIKTNYLNKQDLCLLKIELSQIKNQLIGSYIPINNKSNCLSGNLILTKVKNLIIDTSQKYKATIEKNRVDSSKIIVETKPIKMAPENPISNSRINKVIKEVVVDEQEAELYIYDYGTIDGDVITLLDNDRILYDKLLLSEKPVKCIINGSTSKVHNIKFFAENLGTIPPNTGSLIIKTKTKRLEMSFSSDLDNTSSIKIIFNSH
jgi:hypothetical protein